MRTIKIIGRKNNFFDVFPASRVMVDGKQIGILFCGKKEKGITIELDENPHEVYCEYTYQKYNIERSNVIRIEDNKNHTFVLGAVNNTYLKKVNENFENMFSKGVNVTAIELYEKEYD